LVSLLQVPGGDVQQRKTIISNEPMDLADIERLVAELKMQPATLTHDTWSDGEWELRVRGPKGQLIHGYDSVGPDEIGGAKGQTLLDTLTTVIPTSDLAPAGPIDEAAAVDSSGLFSHAPEPAPATGEEAGATPGAVPPAVAPPTLAPSAAALRRGQRILVVKQGQIADAIVMMVRPHDKVVDVMFGGGHDETLEAVPVEDIVEPAIELPEVGVEDEDVIEVSEEDLAGDGRPF